MIFLLYISVIFLIDSVAGAIPTPVNVSVQSVNFNHVLRWDPASGTPPGTQYTIIQRRRGSTRKKWLKSTESHLKLKLDNTLEYYFTVQASYKNNTSKESRKVRFSPLEETIIDPPKVSLAGCGNCIYGNISLLEPDNSPGIDDITKVYPAIRFRVYWGRPHESMIIHETKEKSFNLTNLERGQKYCVHVETLLSYNKNIAASDRVCAFTSILEPSRVPALLGVIAGLMIIVTGGLIVLMLCLYHTGLLCKMKSSVPRALILEKMVLLQGKIVTLEKMIPDLISVSSEMDKQRDFNDPTRPNAAGSEDEDDDAEEEDDNDKGEKSYMYRHAKTSSGENCQESHDVSEISKVASSTDFDEEFEAHDETTTEKTVVAFIPKRSPYGVEGHVESDEENIKDDKEPCNTVINVNLFSVKLAAMTGSGTEGGQHDCRDSHTGILKLSGVKPLLPTHSKQNLCHVDSLIVTVDQPTSEFLQPAQDSDATCYMGRHTENCPTDGLTQEGEEDKEEFSEYMGRM